MAITVAVHAGGLAALQIGLRKWHVLAPTLLADHSAAAGHDFVPDAASSGGDSGLGIVGCRSTGPRTAASFGLIALAGLEGFSATLLHALGTALLEASPPIRGIPDNDTVNMLNGQALAAEYADLISGFARSGILERERLQRIGSALGSRYVLLPGLAELNQVIIDRFEISGLKLIQSRVTTLRVWLQRWDARMGQLLWQSTSETTLATRLLRPEQTP